MARYKISPTKTNLFKVKREHEFAKEGHQLLEQKRDIVLAELMSTLAKALESQKMMDEAVRKAHEAMQQAVVRMGRRRVDAATLAVNDRVEVVVHQRMVIGVRVPGVKVISTQHPPYGSPYGTSAWLDEAQARFRNVLQLSGRLAELKITVLRLSEELRKTVRRVNVLEKTYIPDYEDTIKYITASLDEQARGSFFVLKLVKSRLAHAAQK